MAIKVGNKKEKTRNIFFTIIVSILICSIFLTMISFFYSSAEEEAYEMLHIQTKQIKDDLALQMKSDKENLATMANFAAKLYANGEDYSIMFDSFKPIGLFSRIGILTPDCIFITKDGRVDLSDRMSFEEQALLGDYITGRTYSYSIPDEQVVRTSIPFKVNGEVVGIMYGIIKIETINEKYNNMAQELDAQLFVYDKGTGKFIIDTIEKNPGELSQFKNRQFNEGFSFEDFLNNDNGFSSFKSILTGENLHLHYSTLEDFDWGIMLARYENQVFAKTHLIAQLLLISFLVMILVIVLYLIFILNNERSKAKLTSEASGIRKLLLEINQKTNNVSDALKKIQNFSISRSAFFIDTDGEEYNCVNDGLTLKAFNKQDKSYFCGELFKYTSLFLNNNNNRLIAGTIEIRANKHLLKINPTFYSFLKEKGIKTSSFAIITDRNNHTSILGVLNPKRSYVAKALLEDVAICFTIAVYNKKHLNKTEIAATTDSLTGVLNRVAYKKDVLMLDEEKPENFACVYIDVNELHLRNNKYGHAAGDEMLIRIANALKESFFGQSVYRMGGDEFLVFARNSSLEYVQNNLCSFKEQIAQFGYNVAVGISFRSQNTNCDEMVREAETRMYEAKAEYYQNKEHTIVSEGKEKDYVHVKTGIREIDSMISVLKEHYNGIYGVSLDTDSAHRILMPAYLESNEDEADFSKLLTKYINDTVHPDYSRGVLSFLNYEVIRRQLSEAHTPRIRYKKITGDMVALSVYPLDETGKNTNETLWVFAKD